MQAIASWQAVLSELGLPAVEATQTSRAYTPTAAAAAAGVGHSGRDVFYTPLQPAQSATPVDAWHTILSTLTGNEANQRHGAAASTSQHSSPRGSPDMVRQLFGSAPRNIKPDYVGSSTGSTPRRIPGQIQPQNPSAASAGPPGLDWNSAVTGKQQLQQLQAQDQDVQQLADRLHSLRASAESILHVSGQTASPAAAKQQQHAASLGLSPPRSSAGARGTARVSSSMRAGPCSSSTAAPMQEGSPVPRKLFQSPTRCNAQQLKAASNSSSPLRRLLAAAQTDGSGSARTSQAAAVRAVVPPLDFSSLQPGSTQPTAAFSSAREPMAMPSSAAAADAALKLAQQQDLQGPAQQQHLQQHLDGALSRVEQLLAHVSVQQQWSDRQPVSSRSSRTPGMGDHLQQSRAGPAWVADLQQQHGVLQQIHQQSQPQPGQRQQQELLQQLVLQQQTIIQQLLPLVSGAGQPPAAPAVTNTAAALAAANTAAADRPAAAPAPAQAAGGSADADAAPSGLQSQLQPRSRLGSTIGALANNTAPVELAASSQMSDTGDGRAATAAAAADAPQQQRDSGSTQGNAGGSHGHNGAGSSADGNLAGAAFGSSSRRRRWQLPLPASAASCDGASASPEAAAVGAPAETNEAGVETALPDAAAAGGHAAAIQGSEAAAAQLPSTDSDEHRGVTWVAAADAGLPTAGVSLSQRQLGGEALGQHMHSVGDTCSSSGCDGHEAPSSSGHVSKCSSWQSAVSNSYAGQPPAAAAAAPHDGGKHATQHEPAPAAGTEATRALAANIAHCESQEPPDPVTPTAALPRVHTPGKAAAEVAAELTTPQLAHSTAAVMTVSEAWRDESSSAQTRWQQLLADWSASDLDTWESQRLSEPSAASSVGQNRTSGPGLKLALLAAANSAQLAQQQHQQQQQQAGQVWDAAGKGRQSLGAVPEVLAVGASSAGGSASRFQQEVQRQIQQQQSQQQEQQPVTFTPPAGGVSVTLTPRMPTADEPRVLQQHMPPQPDNEALQGGPEAPEVHAAQAAQNQQEHQLQGQQQQHLGDVPQQQQQQGPVGQEAEMTGQGSGTLLPTMGLDTTRKQLFSWSPNETAPVSRTSSGSSGHNANACSSSAADAAGALLNPDPASSWSQGLADVNVHQQHRASNSRVSAAGAEATFASLRVSADAEFSEQQLSQQQQQQLLQHPGQPHQQEQQQPEPHQQHQQESKLLPPEQHQQQQPEQHQQQPMLLPPQQVQQQQDEPHQQEQQQPEQQQQQDTEEAEGLERLNQLLHDLQGLQKRIGSMQLQPPKHTARPKQSVLQGIGGAAVAGAASVTAAQGDADTAAHSSSSSNSSSSPSSSLLGGGAAAPAHSTQQQAAAVAGLSSVQRTAAGTDRASAVVQQQAQASHAGSTLTLPDDAFARIALLKQQLQDSRVALQAIATPTRGDLQPFEAFTPGSAAAGTAIGSGQQPQPVSMPADNSSSTQTTPASASAGLYAAVATSHTPSSASTPPAGAAAGASADLRTGGGMRVSAGGSGSAWLSGGPLQQYLDRRISTGRGARVSSSEVPANRAADSSNGTTGFTPRSVEGRERVSGSAAQFGVGGAGSLGSQSTNAGSAYVQALVAKWHAAAAANEDQQAAGGVPQAPVTAAQQHALQNAHGDNPVPSWQQLLDQAYPGLWPARQQDSTNMQVPATSKAEHSTGNAQASGMPQWLKPATISGPHGSGLAGNAAASVPSNALTPRAGLFASLSPMPFGLSDPHTAGRGGMGVQHMGSNGSSSRPAGQHSSITPQNTGTPGWANGFPPLSAVTQGTPSNPVPGSAGGARSFGSGSKGAALQGLLLTGGSSSRSVGSSSSRTPPSTGNLTRWARQGSPTRQLRQQLRSAAKDFQQQQQERQQQLQAVQVTPVSAALAHNVAVIDRTLAGLRSVSPVGGVGRAGAVPSYAVSAHQSGDGSSATPHSSSSRGPVDVLSGAAAAAEAIRDGLLTATAQGAATRSVSPVQRFRQQGWARLT